MKRPLGRGAAAQQNMFTKGVSCDRPQSPANCRGGRPSAMLRRTCALERLVSSAALLSSHTEAQPTFVPFESCEAASREHTATDPSSVLRAEHHENSDLAGIVASDTCGDAARAKRPCACAPTRCDTQDNGFNHFPADIPNAQIKLCLPCVFCTSHLSTKGLFGLLR